MQLILRLFCLSTLFHIFIPPHLIYLRDNNSNPYLNKLSLSSFHPLSHDVQKNNIAYLDLAIVHISNNHITVAEQFVIFLDSIMYCFGLFVVKFQEFSMEVFAMFYIQSSQKFTSSFEKILVAFGGCYVLSTFRKPQLKLLDFFFSQFQLAMNSNYKQKQHSIIMTILGSRCDINGNEWYHGRAVHIRFYPWVGIKYNVSH